MKEIKLTQGKVALVDDEDYERLNKSRWLVDTYHTTDYAYRFLIRNLNGERKKSKLYMHNEILVSPLGMEIDHRDSNGLNNQKFNLRFCTKSQNQGNSKSRTGTSKYKGVSWDRKSRKWFAGIKVSGYRTHLGSFEAEKDAALVYNVAAIEHFGEFARLNTVNQVSREDILGKLEELGL